MTGPGRVRIVHVNTSGKGGAARAAVRLHRALRAGGTDSVLLVREELDPSEPGMTTGPQDYLRPLGSAAAVLDEGLRRMRRDGNGSYFTAALLPNGVIHQIRACAPDLVHLHWVGNGFVPPEALRRLGVPIVWTLHDFYPFTGGCHYPATCTRYEERCGECPALGSRRTRDLSRLGWWRKARAWGGVDLTTIAPSRWMAERARRSSLFRQRRIEVIPNSLDLDVFRPADRAEARAALGLPPEARLILFSAFNGVTDPRKGFTLLVEALAGLAQRGAAAGMRLVVAGSERVPGAERCGLPVHNLGILQDEPAMARAIVAADVVVVPSIEENLPNAALEAHACGVPVVAFRAGGTADIVVDRATGALAEPYHPESLGAAITWVLEEPNRCEALANAARQRAEAEYSASVQARMHRALYDSIRRGARGKGDRSPDCRSDYSGPCR